MEYWVSKVRNDNFFFLTILPIFQGSNIPGPLFSPVPGDSGKRGLSLELAQLIFKILDRIVDPSQFRA